MKVVYVRTISEKLRDAINEADKQNKRIEKFELGRYEARQLYQGVARFMHPGVDEETYMAIGECTYFGYRCEWPRE